MKVKELMELANIKELKEGPVYIMLVDESVDLGPISEVECLVEMFAPVDVRILQVADAVNLRIFELEPTDGPNAGAGD